MTETGMAEYDYVAEYRQTRMGGITWPIAVCTVCRQVIYPYAILGDTYPHTHTRGPMT